MTSSDDAAGRDELSRMLRELRANAQMSGTQAAAAAGFSQAKISRIENGVNVPSPQDVSTLAGVYRASAGARRRLEALAEDVQEEFRRVVLHRGAADFQHRVGRIEESSAAIRTFTPTIVPGLLQTADYARAVFSSGNLSADDVEAAVAARLSRQGLLRQEGRRFVFVTAESSLRWCAGAAEIMLAQLEHVSAISQRPNVRLGVIPWGTPAQVFPLHSWDMYDQRAVIVGTATATAILTNHQDIKAYRVMFDKLARMAVYDEDARDLLVRIRSDYQ